MRLINTDDKDKGWSIGPWNSALDIAIGYANAGINEPHVHHVLTEIYLVGRGNARIRIGQKTILLGAGDILIVEPEEAHTFIESSPDYFHFVIHSPVIKDDKSSVTPPELGR